jgi:hypothetical protein
MASMVIGIMILCQAAFEKFFKVLFKTRAILPIGSVRSEIFSDPELALTNSLKRKMFNVSFVVLGTLVFVIFS